MTSSASENLKVSDTVCVTGASGFCASWLVMRLLERGYKVRAAVRNPENVAKTSHLRALPAANDRLEIVKGELLNEDDIVAAVSGCEGVFHVATPIIFETNDPERDMIRPAVRGTINVLKASLKSLSVRRIVYTSSVAAVEQRPANQLPSDFTFDESSWSSVDYGRTFKSDPSWIAPYSVSKTLSEQAAFDFAQLNGIDFVSVVPSLVVGAFLTPEFPNSVRTALAMVTGESQHFPYMRRNSYVDVDDLARAQIFVYENPDSKGRYLCSAKDAFIDEVAQMLKLRYPELPVVTDGAILVILSLQERMTLKHKNTSKWAKRIIQRGLKANRDGSRDAIAEQLRIHEALTRKIHSANNESSSDDSSGEDTDSATGEIDSNLSQVMKSRASFLAKSKIETLKVLEGDAEAEIPTTGLFSLPFMARAIEKKRKQANDEALAVLEDLDQFESINDRTDGFGGAFQENLDVPQDLGVRSGRLGFGAMAKLPSVSKGMDAQDGLNMHVEDGSSSEDISEDKDIALTVRSSNKMRKEKDIHTLGKQNCNKNFPLSEVLDDFRLQVAERVSGTVSGYLNEEQNDLKASKMNPWLFGELSEKTCVGNDANRMIATKRDQRKEDSGRIDVQKSSEENKMPDQTLLQESEILEPQVTIAGGENVVLSGVSAIVKKNMSANKIDFSTWENPVDSVKSFDVANIEESKMLGSAGSSDSDGEHENEGMEKLGFQLMTRNESQAELIQRAFAGDNVEADFEQLKSQALDEEVPVGETPLNLPGWGQWTDVQKKKGQPLWMLQKEEELKTKRNLALSKRKDCNLKHVIISEKLDKKAEKFLSPSLPFPYQSRETFDRSIRMPIGREFNPDHAFRDMIRPSVIKHAGVIIDPIKYTMSEASNGRDSFSLPRKKRKGGERGSVSVYKQSKLDSPQFPKSNKVAR